MILSTLGRWALNHPVASRHPSAEGNLDRDGMKVSGPIRRKGELGPRWERAKFPSIGGVGDTGPRAMCRVGGQARGG